MCIRDSDEPVERAGALHRLVPHPVQHRLRHRRVRLPQHRQQLAAHLPVRAGVRLPPPGRTRVLRLAGQPPGALGGDRTPPAPLVLRRAHQRAQLHGGGGPARGRVLALGQQLTGEPALGGRRRVRRVLHPRHRAREDPAHIRVQHRMPLPVRERGHRGGRVLTDAGQCQQLRVARRYVPAVPFRYGDGGAVQPQGPARIAEPAPGAHRLARGLLGQVGGAGPAGQPLLVDGQHPVDRGLLEHELADHHTPRTRLRAAPGEVAGVGVEPGDHGGVKLLSHGLPILPRLAPHDR